MAFLEAPEVGAESPRNTEKVDETLGNVLLKEMLCVGLLNSGLQINAFRWELGIKL